MSQPAKGPTKVGRQPPWLDGAEASVFLFAAALLSIRVFDHRVERWLIKEDGIAEYVTALGYFMAAYLAFTLARRLHASARQANLPAVIWCALAFGFAVFALEEISWGQRIFGFSTPEVVAASNFQNETTIHNLTPVLALLDWPYMLLGLYGMVGWLVFKAFRISASARHFRLDLLIVPPRYAILFVPLFLQAFWWYFLKDGGTWPWFEAKDEEIGEVLFALGCALWIRYRIRGEEHSRLR